MCRAVGCLSFGVPDAVLPATAAFEWAGCPADKPYVIGSIIGVGAIWDR
jgi:hypothetical protein